MTVLNNALITYPSEIDESKDFQLIEQHLPAGTEFPLHWHDYIELQFIVSGSAMHNYNGTTYTIVTGSAYMMCFYDFHAVTALTDVTLYSIHFNKSALHPDLLPYLDFNRFCCQFDESETDRILGMLRRLKEESKQAQPFFQMLQHNILSELVVLMIRKSTTQAPHAAPPLILRAIAHINANFQSNLTLKELSDVLCFSPNYLGQLFKNQTGRTFNDYLNTVRLKYACRLLSITSLTAKEIAFSSGYSSVEYFMYIFKKKMAMTPNEYRLQNCKPQNQ